MNSFSLHVSPAKQGGTYYLGILTVALSCRYKTLPQWVAASLEISSNLQPCMLSIPLLHLSSFEFITVSNSVHSFNEWVNLPQELSSAHLYTHPHLSRNQHSTNSKHFISICRNTWNKVKEMAKKSIKQGKLTTAAAKHKVWCYWDPLSPGIRCRLLKAHWKQAEPALT